MLIKYCATCGLPYSTGFLKVLKSVGGHRVRYRHNHDIIVSSTYASTAGVVSKCPGCNSAINSTNLLTEDELRDAGKVPLRGRGHSSDVHFGAVCSYCGTTRTWAGQPGRCTVCKICETCRTVYDSTDTTCSNSTCANNGGSIRAQYVGLRWQNVSYI